MSVDCEYPGCDMISFTIFDALMKWLCSKHYNEIWLLVENWFKGETEQIVEGEKEKGE